MTLTVEPSALSGYARQLDRANEDVEAVLSYVRKHADGGTGGELISIARAGHSHVVEVIEATFNRLGCLLETSSPELNRAAGYYRNSDLAAAIQIDQSLPAAPGRCPGALEYEFTSNPCKPLPFGDVRFPESRLTAPPEPGNPSNSMGWMDYLSPTSWAMKGFDIVLGFDPIAEMQNKLVGDWEALASMQPVLANVGAALHDVALNIQAGATTLNPAWRGNAGDAAYRYFTDLAATVAELGAPIIDIGGAYLVMADAVWAAGEAIGGVLKGMIDSAIIAGVAAAAGTVTAETGVGALVGYGVAAGEAVNILRLWGEATKLYQNATAAVLLFRTVLARTLSDLDQVGLPVVPGGAGYDHPLVTPGGRGA